MSAHVILFDRQEITRQGIATLLPPGCGTSVVAAKSELVDALVRHPEAAVVIDYARSDLPGAESLLNIGLRFPLARWLLFSDELNVPFLKKILCEAAFGAVLKGCALDEIRTGLAAALDGGAFVCAPVWELLLASDRDGVGEGGPLTVTEKDILRQIALGLSAKAIAARRNVSTHTVVTHRKNIYRKIGVNNSQEAAGYALRAGIVEASDYSI